MASAFEVHTASEMVCLAQAGKLRLAQEASARKLATTEGSAFVGPIAVKSFPRFRASLHNTAKNFVALGPRRPVDDKTKGVNRRSPSSVRDKRYWLRYCTDAVDCPDLPGHPEVNSNCPFCFLS